MEASNLGTGSLCNWDWQRELEVFAGRISRGCADEAAAARRAGEEAERAALQRVQEAERRQLAWQTEESAALQNFLTGWHYAMDARFEQLAAQMATLQKRSDEEAAEGVRTSTLVEALTSRLDKYEAKAQADLQGFQQDLKDKEQQIEQLTTGLAEVGIQVSSCKLELKGLKEAQEAMSTLEHRLQEVETRGTAVARGLRALEPFVEQVTARLEPLEPAIEGIRSELSASSQIHRTSIAAQGKRMEEGFKALQDEVAKYQEDGPRMMQAVQEVGAVAEAATKRAMELDIEMKQAAGNIHELINVLQLEVTATDAKHWKQIEAAAADLGKLRAASAADLQSTVERLRQELRREFQDGVNQAVTQAKESLVEKLLRVEGPQKELQKQFQELQSSSRSSAEMLQSLQRENRKLADDFEKTKGKGVSYEWKIPRCLQRLRYLSLLTEPGLWLDSEPFFLGSLGPLEMRLYTKGLRGGNGQCAVALRLREGCQSALPLMVDLLVGDSTRRAAQCPDPEGLDSVLWLAESMGSLEEHLVDDLAELTLRTELPLLAAPTLLTSRAPSSIGSLDDLRPEPQKQAEGLRPTQQPGTDLKSRPETRPLRDVRGVPSREQFPTLPTLPLADPSSGVFALRGSWGAPKVNPFEELMPSNGQRNPVAVPDDDAAR